MTPDLPNLNHIHCGLQKKRAETSVSFTASYEIWHKSLLLSSPTPTFPNKAYFLDF